MISNLIYYQNRACLSAEQAVRENLAVTWSVCRFKGNSETTLTRLLFGFLQLIKLTPCKLKEWAAFQWSCSSALSTVPLPNRTHKSSRSIIAESLACLFSRCEKLPSCGFCSTVLTAVAQTQQAGNVLLCISHSSDKDKL